MKRYLPLFASAAICATLPVSAQDAKPYPAPSEIVAAAKADDWVAIAPSDLLVMDLAPDSKGKQRRVVIQLIPAPFSQGWVSNIRKLAAAHWWDGTSINRVQDNYVVQWGDATEKKALPDGLAAVPESAYSTNRDLSLGADSPAAKAKQIRYSKADVDRLIASQRDPTNVEIFSNEFSSQKDAYASVTHFLGGWPTGSDKVGNKILTWPIHCYAMVGVGRNLSPDTGTGAELYTVIGHAPRHLDRNIALVGRVIEGIEHMSSLPRGTGALGFYEKEEERVPILSVRLGNEAKDVPAFEYLATDSGSFAAYADARANRRDPFFNVPAGGADICNIPVPIRRKAN
jgi:cyclophilin family peptidyl-prolyl cis-trans isomerase